MSDMFWGLVVGFVRRLGHSFGISCRTGFSDPGHSRSGGSVAGAGPGVGVPRLGVSVGAIACILVLMSLSISGVWFCDSPQLFVLPGGSISLDETRLHGPDVSQN